MMKKRKLVLSQGPVDFVKFILQVVGVVVFVHAFFLKPFYIPSGSMIPSLLVGDYLFVSKYTYGFSRYSFPFGDVINYFNGRIGQFKSPRRGDVVVFRLPQDPKTDYIKRVIGLPGDRIQMRGGRLFINDVVVAVKPMGDYKRRVDVAGRWVYGSLYEQKIPGGTTHRMLRQLPFGTGSLDETPVYTVPSRHYFMMGDNANGSKDSRVLHEFGYIPEEYLVGQAQCIFFSTDGTARYWEFWKWLSAVRYSRLLSWVS